QDRSLVVRLTFTCDRVFNRNPYPHCSRVSVRRAAQLFKHASVTLRIAKLLQDWLLSFLEFIACGCGLVFSFRHDTNFLFFVVNKRMRWNAFCQENVGTDSRIGANDGVATHDRGSGVNADAIFDCRVAFFTAQSPPCPERSGDERHALVKFHMRPDFSRLANDNSSAVVYEEVRADLRAGMNIDSGPAMCPLGHDAWNERHL